MKPIFLIGYMGCGKSTLGRTVARLTGCRFIDLDSYIEEHYGHTVRELFDLYGEDGFRQRERDMLHQAASDDSTLIACGGGTPCFFDNMEWMNSRGVTIWLSVSVDTLHRRLLRGRHKRPLIAHLSDTELLKFISDALLKRTPYYAQSSHIFKADVMHTEAEKEDTARRFIETFLS